MPALSIAAATALGAGLSSGSNIISSWMNRNAQRDANRQNIAAQERINAANIDWARENTNLARQWAIDDWNKTNAYNSPLQQMQRLKEAGLNPHLVYGGGSATNIASMVKGTTPQAPSLSAPHVNALPPIDLGMQNLQNTFMSASLANQELKNKQSQNDLLQQQLIKGDLDIAGKALSNETGRFNLQQKQALNDTAIQSARTRLEQMEAEKQRTLLQVNQMPRELAIKEAELKIKQAKSKVEINNALADLALKTWTMDVKNPLSVQQTQAAINNLKTTGALLELDRYMRSQGIERTDPIYTRVIMRHLEDLQKGLPVDSSTNQNLKRILDEARKK